VAKLRPPYEPVNRKAGQTTSRQPWDQVPVPSWPLERQIFHVSG
jgi:hypothetical protein